MTPRLLGEAHEVLAEVRPGEQPDQNGGRRVETVDDALFHGDGPVCDERSHERLVALPRVHVVAYEIAAQRDLPVHQVEQAPGCARRRMIAAAALAHPAPKLGDDVGGGAVMLLLDIKCT